MRVQQCVRFARYARSLSINVFPANTFFNDAYWTISDIQFIAMGRVAPVMGYKYNIYIARLIIEHPREWLTSLADNQRVW